MFSLPSVIYAFYINEFIDGFLSKEKDTKFLKSHERFRAEFLAMRERFNTILARVLHDYIILVSARELTSSYKFCEFTVERFLGHEIWYCYDNDRLIDDNFQYLHIPSFIDICEEIFHNSHWTHELFGGENWWTGMRYIRDIYPKNKVLFIDSVIDIQHNTSTLFDKANPWFMGCRKSIALYLDERKTKTDEYDLFVYLISREFNKDVYLAHLYRRFVYLYLPDLPDLDDAVYTYLPIAPNDFKQSFWRAFWRTQPTEFTGEYRHYNIVDVTELPDYNDLDLFKYG